MNTVIYDEGEQHDFATRKILLPLLAYRRDIKRIESLDGVKNSRILAYYNHFNPESIVRLKNDGNKLYSIDVNDGSPIGSSYMGSEEVLLMDMIFKFSGLQNTQYSNQLTIKNDFTFYSEPRIFMPDKEWGLFNTLRTLGKIVPMPHVPWFTTNEGRPWKDRKKNVLIRGGLHFYRFLLYLSLLRQEKVDEDSNFHVKCYFDKNMAEHHRYCPDCLTVFHNNGGLLSYKNYKEDYTFNCKERYEDWTGNLDEGFFQRNHPTIWNNGCIPFFYWIADKFEAQYGPIDKLVLQKALHGDYLNRDKYWDILTGNAFYADYKWLFCIDIPPRFWEGAGAKTVTLLPKWTEDQTHFPELKEGEHYLAFNETMTDLQFINEVTQEQYEHIANNCKNLYDQWIKFDQHELNTNLMDFMMEIVENT